MIEYVIDLSVPSTENQR